MSTDYQKLAGQLMGQDASQALARNAAGIQKLAESEDGKKVRALIGDEGKLAGAVESGDAETLKSILRSVLSTEEGARLAQQLSLYLK